MAASKDKSPDSGPVFAGERTKERSAARVQRASTIAPFGYLRPEAEFGDVERGNPLPYTLDVTRRRKMGLERETWQLEVIADPESNAKIEQPLSKELGTVLDFKALVQLGQVHGVQYLKGITCNKTGVVDCLAGDFLASPCFLIQQPDAHRNGRFAIRWCTGLPNFQLLTRAPTRFIAGPSTTTVLRSRCRGLFPRVAE